MKLFRYLFLAFALASCASNGVSYVEDNSVMTMNTSWGFWLGDVEGGESVTLDDANWQPIEVPHIMRLEPKHCGGNIIYQGIGWYRRYFTVDASHKDQKVYLDFEGVMTSCVVYINGQKAIEHFGGYMGFEVDATPFIKWGETNVVAVRVSAEHDPLTPPGKPQEGMDFNYFSGIYRDVRMKFKDCVHITNPVMAGTEAGGGIFVTYPEVSEEHASVNIKTQVINENQDDATAKVLQLLRDSEGNLVAKSEQSVVIAAGKVSNVISDFTVDNPNLWHPYSPYLYRLETNIEVGGKVVDHALTKIGIRTIRQTTEGFFINGEKLYLRGTNRHQCFPNVGDAVSNSMHRRDALLIKQGGYNAVRAAHYTHDPEFLDACDEYGLMVVECIPGWQHWTDNPIFAERLYEAGREMIRRDRNHPSIFLWETMLNETRYPKHIADSIQHIAHAEYPGDQMYTAGDYWGHQEVAECFDTYYKQVDKFPADGDVMTNIPEDMVSIAALYSREWGDGAGDKPRVSLAEDEYEQWRQCRSRLECLDGRGYFDWCMLDANPNMAGHFSWCFMDITRGLSRTTEYCGAVDLNRYPKMSYYMHQSMRDPHISQPGIYEGPMVHIASYNYGGFDSSDKNIWVFSNCDSVTLYRNDTKVGTITREEASTAYANIVNKGGSPAYIFNVEGYEAGTLKADAYLDGKIAASHSVSTAGKAHHLNIRLANDNISPIADGSDMIPIWIEVMDADGNRVTDSEALIHISIEGQGKLIGEGNAYAAIENQYVEGGIGFCFVRTSSKAGKIVIKASGEGLEPASSVVKSVPATTHEAACGNGTKFAGKEAVPEIDPSELVPLSQRYNAVKIWKIYASEKSASEKYPLDNIIDGDDESWWISSSGKFPQTVTVEFSWPTYITAGRIKFQKDSSVYRHRVEVSRDGKNWTEVFTRESTGWDIKPFKLACEVQCMRITFLDVSEGNPGLAEVSLYE